MTGGKIVLKGRAELLKPIIMQTLTTYQLLEDLALRISPDNGSNLGVNAARRYKPMVKLYFSEDASSSRLKTQNFIGPNYQVCGRIAFRLMGYTEETITTGYLKSIGMRIKQIFGENNGFVWQKGKRLFSYADWDKGYQLQLLCRNEGIARELVQKILSIQEHTPIWSFLTESRNMEEEQAYPDTPKKQFIAGKEVAVASRPLANVRFRRAEVKINKLRKPIVIYDRTNRRVGALNR